MYLFLKSVSLVFKFLETDIISDAVTLIINPLQQAPHSLQSTFFSTSILIAFTSSSIFSVSLLFIKTLKASFSSILKAAILAMLFLSNSILIKLIL